MKDYSVFRAKEQEQILPFYPRSTGKEIYDEGDVRHGVPLDFVEICWVVSGICEFKLKQETLILREGDAICKMPMEVRYKKGLRANTVVYWATFDGACAEQYIRSWGFPKPPLHPGKCPFHFFNAIGKGLLSTSPDDARKLITVYSGLIAALFNGDQEGSDSGSILKESLMLMNTNLEDPDFNINSLAEKLGIHRITIDRIIKKHLGISPIEYLTNCRIRRALELLSETTLPLDSITRKIGFRNSNYLCRLIKRHTNMTPKEYRMGEKRRIQ